MPPNNIIFIYLISRELGNFLWFFWKELRAMTASKPCPNTTSTCFKEDYEGELLCHLSNSQCSFFLFSRTKNSAIYWFEMGYHRNKDWVRSGCIYQLILCVYLSDVKGILGHFKLAKCSEDYIRRKVRQLTSASLPKACELSNKLIFCQWL